MRLYAKLLIAILFVNGMVLGSLVAQRYFFPTYVEDVLATDNSCGLDCWFGVAEEMNHREIATNISNAGGTDQIFRGSLMRYRLPDPNTGENRGTIQVALDDKGNASQVCYFPQDFTLGDIIATFGEPAAFYLDRNRRRQIFSRVDFELEAYVVRFEMIYPDDNLVFQGEMYVSLDTIEKVGMSPHTPIDQMCNPGIINYFWLKNLPEWDGFYVDIEDYFASSPPSPSDSRDNFVDPLQFR